MPAEAAMVLLDNGKFLTELHKLYEGNKDKGTVWVTMKRSERRGPAACAAPLAITVAPSPPASRRLPNPAAPPPRRPAANLKPRKGKGDYSAHPYQCLLRATDGDRKLSTVVAGGEPLARFQDSYTTIMRVRRAGGGVGGGKQAWPRGVGVRRTVAPPCLRLR